LGNQQCEEGCNDLATIYCECTGRKVFLCDACFPNHRRKNPRMAHVALGVEVTTSSLIYQQRCAEFVKRREELLGFVGKVEECSAELGRAVDEVMTELQIYRETQITELRQWKAQLASLLYYCFQEVEASLNQENPALQGQYSPFLRGVQTDCPLYFDFRVDTASMQTCVHSFLSLIWERPQAAAPYPNIVQPQASPQVPLYNTVQSQGYPQAPFGYPVQPQVASPAYNYNQGLQQGPQNPLFYTVQPQVPAPLPPLAEVHSSMAGALAAAQSVQICEICNNPFMDARMGRYCSLGCSQQANKQPAQFPPQQPAQFPPQQPQQFMQRAMRKCTFCTNFVTSTLTLVPPHLRHFEKFASEVCSVGCLEKFEKVEEQEIDTPCLGCKGRGKISDSWAPTLPCGHRFHNKDCLFVFIQKVSGNFYVSNPNFLCSQCHKTFRLCDVLRYFNGSEFEQRKQTVLQSNCCVCNYSAVDRALHCGHMVCIDHRSGGGQMCRFCNSYQSFQ